MYMYQIAIEKLLKWKQSKCRKPLMIEGARQVGKTWLMKEFGRQAYADTVYINIMEVLEDKTYPFQVNQDNPKIFFIENQRIIMQETTWFVIGSVVLILSFLSGLLSHFTGD